MTLTPAEFEEVKRAAAREIADRYFQSVELDQIQTLEIATAAAFLGIPVHRAAQVLPVIEVGPRSRRVTVADYKAFLQARTQTPATR